MVATLHVSEHRVVVIAQSGGDVLVISASCTSLAPTRSGKSSQQHRAGPRYRYRVLPQRHCRGQLASSRCRSTSRVRTAGTADTADTALVTSSPRISRRNIFCAKISAYIIGVVADGQRRLDGCDGAPGHQVTHPPAVQPGSPPGTSRQCRGSGHREHAPVPLTPMTFRCRRVHRWQQSGTEDRSHAHRFVQLGDFFARQHPKASWPLLPQRHGADIGADQRLHRESDRGQHPSHDPLTSFMQNQPDQ